ncbi:unnamed protein product [Closterium sp. NIES-54]
MTTLRVLLHVAAQRNYELHSLDFSTAFPQGSLHEEIWLRRPPGFTGSFPPGTQWSLRRPVYGLRQAPREWHDTLRTTLAALGFAPSTADPSLFLRTDTSLPLFYILVYVDDLRSYLGLQITRDRAQRTITLTQSHMVQQVLQRFDFTYSSPQATPLSTRHSLSALPSDESVEPSGPYPELVGCLMYLMTCTRPDLAYPLSILARYVAPGRHRPEHMAAAKRVLRYLCSHADASWADDQATQRSSLGYTFSLGSGSVSWRSTRSSSVLGSSCEAEIYAGAMAAQELRWLTYLLTDLGEQPCSPPVLYVDNKAMLALCREHRLEHITKHIALRYFLARELQQRGQMRLAYVAFEANTADIFTKALAPGDHQRFCTMLDCVVFLLWHDTLRTTLAALGFTLSTADPSLFLRTDTSLPPFYILVYVDDLVFATADTEALALVKSELQKRHTCTDLGELHSYLGLQITRDRARRTITLTQSHMVQQVLQRFGFTWSSAQATPLATGHSLSAPPSDESVEPSGPYPELVGCLMYLMTCTRPDLAYPLGLLARYVAPGRHRKVHMDAAKRVLRYLCSTSGMGLVLGGRGDVVLTGHSDGSWVDDQATQRSSQGYTFRLGSGSVSWRSTRSSSVLGSSCEAKIYATAMAAQELRWLTYLLTDLGERPCSPPVLYVDNKAAIALSALPLCNNLHMREAFFPCHASLRPSTDHAMAAAFASMLRAHLPALRAAAAATACFAAAAASASLEAAPARSSAASAAASDERGEQNASRDGDGARDRSDSGDSVGGGGNPRAELTCGTLHVPLPLDKLMCHVAGTGRLRDDSSNSLFKGRPPGDHPQAVLLLSGSFNPPTIMHLRMLEMAHDALQDRGWDVIGAYMSPVNDHYGKQGLAAAKERVTMCQLACADSPFIMVDPWESSQQCYQRTLCVLRRLHHTFNAPAAPTPSSAAQAPFPAAEDPSSAAQDPSSSAQAPSVAIHPSSPIHPQASLGNQSPTSTIPPHPHSQPAALHPPSQPAALHPPSPTPPHPHTPQHPHMWALEGAMAESPALLPTAGGVRGWERGAEGGQGDGGGGKREEGGAAMMGKERDGRGDGDRRSEMGEVVGSGVQGERRERYGGFRGEGVGAAAGRQGAEGRVQVMLVCGADLLESFTQAGVWFPTHVEEVLGAHGVVCIARQGADARRLVVQSDVLHRHRHNILIVDQPIENNVSSSHIRYFLLPSLALLASRSFSALPFKQFDYSLCLPCPCACPISSVQLPFVKTIPSTPITYTRSLHGTHFSPLLCLCACLQTAVTAGAVSQVPRARCSAAAHPCSTPLRAHGLGS